MDVILFNVICRKTQIHIDNITDAYNLLLINYARALCEEQSLLLTLERGQISLQLISRKFRNIKHKNNQGYLH